MYTIKYFQVVNRINVTPALYHLHRQVLQVDTFECVYLRL